MNIYGDNGNIICLRQRCLWRGIEVRVDQVTIGQKINPDKHDIYFFGGGQDQQQVTVSSDLKKNNGKLLKKAAFQNAVIFAVCGGYQLLGHYYQPDKGKALFGVGLLDVITVAGKKRMIGNIVIELSQLSSIRQAQDDPELTEGSDVSCQMSDKLIGFENHSGKTYLGKGVKPLGKILAGYGNNGKDKTEGAFARTVFGCYLHGSVLPKNPHFADYLISKALERRYGQIKLKPLDDTIEWQAHKSAIARTRSRS